MTTIKGILVIKNELTSHAKKVFLNNLDNRELGRVSNRNIFGQ
jgi:hypothetical protein